MPEHHSKDAGRRTALGRIVDGINVLRSVSGGVGMVSTGHLQPGDGDAVLELIAPSRHGDPGPAMPWSVIHDLHSLVPGSYVLYQEYDVARRRWIISQEIDAAGTRHVEGAGPEEIDALFFELWWADPMLRHQISSDGRSVLLSSDFFPTDRALQGRAYVRELCPHLRSFMTIPLSADHGHIRRVTFAREDRHPFGERDRQVATLLRPHLRELWLNAERQRSGVPALTKREWEVLTLTASGLTHAQIADQLVLSVGTVRKHMENIRTRLGVHTAAAAAALALPRRPEQL